MSRLFHRPKDNARWLFDEAFGAICWSQQKGWRDSNWPLEKLLKETVEITGEEMQKWLADNYLVNNPLR